MGWEFCLYAELLEFLPFTITVSLLSLDFWGGIGAKKTAVFAVFPEVLSKGLLKKSYLPNPIWATYPTI